MGTIDTSRLKLWAWTDGRKGHQYIPHVRRYEMLYSISNNEDYAFPSQDWKSARVCSPHNSTAVEALLLMLERTNEWTFVRLTPISITRADLAKTCV